MEDGFYFDETVKIYDTDLQGIVHYAGYYRFFTDTLEQFSLKKTGSVMPLENEGIWFVVVESNAKYHNPAHVGDKLRVYMKPEVISSKAVKYNFEIKRGSDDICEGYITMVAIDKNKWKAVPLPKEFLDKVSA